MKTNGNVDCYGYNFNGQANDYEGGDAICRLTSETYIATIDILTDIFMIKQNEGKGPGYSKDEFLEAIISLPEGLDAWEIDPATITLAVNGTKLANAEDPQIVDQVLMVKFRLDYSNVGMILNMNVDKVEVKDGNVRVRVEDTPAPFLDLVELTISGSLLGRDYFSGTDAVCVTY